MESFGLQILTLFCIFGPYSTIALRDFHFILINCLCRDLAEKQFIVHSKTMFDYTYAVVCLSYFQFILNCIL